MLNATKTDRISGR